MDNTKLGGIKKPSRWKTINEEFISSKYTKLDGSCSNNKNPDIRPNSLTARDSHTSCSSTSHPKDTFTVLPTVNTHTNDIYIRPNDNTINYDNKSTVYTAKSDTTCRPVNNNNKKHYIRPDVLPSLSTGIRPNESDKPPATIPRNTGKAPLSSLTRTNTAEKKRGRENQDENNGHSLKKRGKMSKKTNNSDTSSLASEFSDAFNRYLTELFQKVEEQMIYP